MRRFLVRFQVKSPQQHESALCTVHIRLLGSWHCEPHREYGDPRGGIVALPDQEWLDRFDRAISGVTIATDRPGHRCQAFQSVSSICGANLRRPGALVPKPPAARDVRRFDALALDIYRIRTMTALDGHRVRTTQLHELLDVPFQPTSSRRASPPAGTRLITRDVPAERRQNCSSTLSANRRSGDPRLPPPSSKFDQAPQPPGPSTDALKAA